MSHEEKTIRVGILGASGYTGAELIRLLVNHPNVEIVLLTADRHAGKSISAVFPHLFGLNLPNLVKIDEVEWAGLEVDIIFCALPHGTTQEIVAGLLHHTGHDVVDELIEERREDLIASIPEGVRVIDLSADFRIEDGDTYAKWYGHPHRAPQLQAQAVYGLTEFARDDIAQARLVACPGCYPASALLALVPLVGAGQIDPDDIIVDSKSGVTGAGRAAKESGLYGEVAEGIHAYALGGHRHGPEIEQELGRVAGRAITLNFTPHLVPMNRGILSTIYVQLADGATAADLRATLEARYSGEPFVSVAPEGMAPATRHVRGSNHSLIGVFEDRVKGRAVVVSVLDNLVKGASGQAVQNMNVMCQFPETRALEQRPMFP
jgi:N-acetyl-gamma-glutamyl-phosphate reductase